MHIIDRIQAFADASGQIVQIEVYDAELLTDPVTDAQERGPLRMSILAEADAPALFAALNQRLAGAGKSNDRIAALRAKYLARENK